MPKIGLFQHTPHVSHSCVIDCGTARNTSFVSSFYFFLVNTTLEQSVIMLPASMSSLFARNLSVQTLYLLVATALKGVCAGVSQRDNESVHCCHAKSTASVREVC